MLKIIMRGKNMEKQIINIQIVTEGEACQMADAEIKQWYEKNLAKIFNPDYGTPKISVEVSREQY